MDDSKEVIASLFAGLFILISFILIIPLQLIINSFVVMKIWNWFLPLILGVTSISFVEALAINLVSTILFKTSGSNTSDNTEDFLIKVMMKLIVAPIFYLSLGWIIKIMLV